jgi:hypothetical protein
LRVGWVGGWFGCGGRLIRSAALSSQLEAMVGGALARASALRVGLGVGRALIVSGSRTRPSHSCDGWVGDLGVVGAPSIFGLARRAEAFAGGLLTFALVSGFQLAKHNRGQCHFRSAAFSSQLEAMVGGALARASALRVAWVSVGLPLRLDRALAHRIRGLLVC